MLKRFIKISLMAIAMMSVMTACDDDNNEENQASESCDDELTLADYQRDAYENLVETNFTKVANGTDTLLQMTCGLESFNGESNTRYAIAENAEDAAALFSSQFGFVLSKELEFTIDDNSITLSLGEYGHVKYQYPSTNPAAFAMAEVQLAGMPYPMYIQYVPQSYVPSNGNSPYEQGMLIEINGQLWLCATSWAGGSTPGYLIRFVTRDDNLLQNRDDHYKRVYFQNDPVPSDAMHGFEFLLSHFTYKNDLYDQVKYLHEINKDLKDAYYLYHLMSMYRDGDQSYLNDIFASHPELESIWAEYSSKGAFIRSIFPFSVYCMVFYNIDISEFENINFAMTKVVKFNTGYSCSGKDYHWKCCRYLYKLELNYVKITSGKFEYLSTGKHHHEWGCSDLSDKYFKDDAFCLAEKKTFTYEPIAGANILWPTNAQ